MNAGLVMTRDLTPAVWGTTASRTRVLVVALIALGAVPALAAAQTTTQVVEDYTTDAIGSVRAVTKQVNGQWQVVARHDFMPFGEEVAPPVPPQDKRLFTGKERDSETGQDYFEAKYDGGARGRFSSVDPIDAVTGSDDREQFEAYLSNPQSWNRYVYVWSNPLRYFDPLGQKVYLVTYTTGNTRGDDEFRRAAETARQRSRNRSGSRPRLRHGLTSRGADEGGLWKRSQGRERLGREVRPGRGSLATLAQRVGGAGVPQRQGRADSVHWV